MAEQTVLTTPSEQATKLKKVASRKKKPKTETSQAATYLADLANLTDKQRQESLQVYRDLVLSIARDQTPALEAAKVPSLLSYLGSDVQKLAIDIDRARKIIIHNELRDEADEAAMQLPKLLEVNQAAHTAFEQAEEKARLSLVEPERLVSETYAAHQAADKIVKRATYSKPPAPGDVDEEYAHLFPDIDGASPIRKAQTTFSHRLLSYKNALDTLNPKSPSDADQIPRVKAMVEYWKKRVDDVDKIVEAVKTERKRLAESFCPYTGLFFPADSPASYRVSAPESAVRIPTDETALAETSVMSGIEL